MLKSPRKHNFFMRILSSLPENIYRNSEKFKWKRMCVSIMNVWFPSVRQKSHLNESWAQVGLGATLNRDHESLLNLHSGIIFGQHRGTCKAAEIEYWPAAFRTNALLSIWPFQLTKFTTFTQNPWRVKKTKQHYSTMLTSYPAP